MLHAGGMLDATSPQNPQPASLDAIDLLLLTELERNGRLTNAALAARAGIAESTCTQRLRSLRDRGVIRGFRADIDPAALGLSLSPLPSAAQMREIDPNTAIDSDLDNPTPPPPVSSDATDEVINYDSDLATGDQQTSAAPADGTATPEFGTASFES